jgi:hypothetical protein
MAEPQIVLTLVNRFRDIIDGYGIFTVKSDRSQLCSDELLEEMLSFMIERDNFCQEAQDRGLGFKTEWALNWTERCVSEEVLSVLHRARDRQEGIARGDERDGRGD